MPVLLGRVAAATVSLLVLLPALALPASADPLATATSTIALTGQPLDQVASPDGKRAYVLVWDLKDGYSRPGAIDVVDVTAGKVIRTIPVGPGPRSLAISPDGRTLALGSVTEKAITLVDARTGKVRARVPVAGPPRQVVIGPKGTSLFAWIDKAGVVKVDLARGKVTGRFPAVDARGNRCTGRAALAMSPDSSTLLVSCSWTGLFFMNPANGKVRTVVYESGGGQPVFSPDGRTVYWGAKLDLSMADIKSGALIRTIDLRQRGDGSAGDSYPPMDIAVSPDGSTVYALNGVSGQVSVVDPQSGTQTGRITRDGASDIGAEGMLLGRGGTRLYVQATQDLLTADTATLTVVGAEPSPAPDASFQTTVSAPLQLAGSRIGRFWATVQDSGKVTSRGYQVLAMPAN